MGKNTNVALLSCFFLGANCQGYAYDNEKSYSSGNEYGHDTKYGTVGSGDNKKSYDGYGGSHAVESYGGGGYDDKKSYDDHVKGGYHDEAYRSGGNGKNYCRKVKQQKPRCKRETRRVKTVIKITDKLQECTIVERNDKRTIHIPTKKDSCESRFEWIPNKQAVTVKNKVCDYEAKSYNSYGQQEPKCRIEKSTRWVEGKDKVTKWHCYSTKSSTKVDVPYVFKVESCYDAPKIHDDEVIMEVTETKCYVQSYDREICQDDDGTEYYVKDEYDDHPSYSDYENMYNGEETTYNEYGKGNDKKYVDHGAYGGDDKKYSEHGGNYGGDYGGDIDKKYAGGGYDDAPYGGGYDGYAPEKERGSGSYGVDHKKGGGYDEYKPAYDESKHYGGTYDDKKYGSDYDSSYKPAYEDHMNNGYDGGYPADDYKKGGGGGYPADDYKKGGGGGGYEGHDDYNKYPNNAYGYDDYGNQKKGGYDEYKPDNGYGYEDSYKY